MKKVNFVLGTMTFGESVFNPEAGEFVKAFLDAGYEECRCLCTYALFKCRCQCFAGDIGALFRNVTQFRMLDIGDGDSYITQRIAIVLNQNAAFVRPISTTRITVTLECPGQ